MNTYLFAWNPKKWPWDDLAKDLETLRKRGRLRERWSCVSHKTVQPGDRAFLVQVGVNPRGIIGAGHIVSYPFLAPHFKDEEKMVYRVDIDFDVLLDPEKDPILKLESLQKGKLAKQTWTPQSSGILIKKEVVGELERAWDEFLSEGRRE